MTIFWVTVASLYGLIIGSFLNAVVYRVPRKETLNTRSHCPKCDRQISAFDNIPLVSYAVLRGKCRGCGLPIPLRYPAVELAGAVVFGLVVWAFGLPLVEELGTTSGVIATLGLLWLAAATIALTLIDLEHHLLPNAIVYPTFAVMLLTLTLSAMFAGDYSRIVHGLMGMAAMGAFYFIVWFWKPGAMGFGDVRLSWVLGFTLAWYSWSALTVGAFAAFFFASVFGVGLLVAQKAGKKTAVAFGPWMLAGAWTGLAVGEPLIDMYLSIGGLR